MQQAAYTAHGCRVNLRTAELTTPSAPQHVQRETDLPKLIRKCSRRTAQYITNEVSKPSEHNMPQASKQPRTPRRNPLGQQHASHQLKVIERPSTQNSPQCESRDTWHSSASICPRERARRPSTGLAAPKENSATRRFSLPSNRGQGSTLSLSIVFTLHVAVQLVG